MARTCVLAQLSCCLVLAMASPVDDDLCSDGAGDRNCPTSRWVSQNNLLQKGTIESEQKGVVEEEPEPSLFETSAAREAVQTVVQAFQKQKGAGDFESADVFKSRGVSVAIKATGANSAFSHNDGSTFPIEVSLKNDGASSYVVMLLESPFEDEIMENLFVTVPSTSSFTGRVVERWNASATAENSIFLGPGDSFSKTFDLNQYMEFYSTGKYSLALDYDLLFFDTAATSLSEAIEQLGATSEESATQADVISNTIEIDVLDAEETSLQETSASEAKQTGAQLSFQGCTSSQQRTLTAAHGVAKQMTAAAIHYLDSRLEGDDWSEWFGTKNPVFASTVTTGIKAIDRVMNGIGYIVDCSCSQSGVYAYVYPTDTRRTVYVCNPVFWRAPARKARDSQPGTIIHELAHFNAIYGTNDYAYGTSALHSLARSNADQARKNSDSVEAYTEDGDLSLSPSGMGGGGTTRPPAPTTAAPPQSPKPIGDLACDFEKGNCLWFSRSAKKWTRSYRGTPSSGTGPSAASSGRYFIFTEASHSGKPHKEFVLESPQITPNGGIVSFSYHMYGATMGSLSFETKKDANGGWTTRWSKSGNQGNSWKRASFTVPPFESFVRIRGVTGGNWESDIAIDGISVSSSTPMTTQRPVTTAAPMTTQRPVTTAAPMTTQRPMTTAAPMTTQMPATTGSPAGGSGCKARGDDASWTFKAFNAKSHGCDWVAKKPNERCGRIGDSGVQALVACPSACGTCYDYYYYSPGAR